MTAARATPGSNRAGEHAGEVEVVGDAVRGLAVHVAARVMVGVSGEASRCQLYLVIGSGIEFQDRGRGTS